MVTALAGWVYLRCYRQMVCVINSRIKYLDQVYKIDKQLMGDFISKASPEKNLKIVVLWRRSDKPGFNRQIRVGNKPLWLEIRAGLVDKALSKVGEDEARITVLGEDHRLYNKIILFINPKHEDIYDPEIGGAVARALRWYVGSKDWPHDEEYRLIQRL